MADTPADREEQPAQASDSAPEGDPPKPDNRQESEAKKNIRRLLSSGGAVRMQDMEREAKRLENVDVEQNIQLKKTYATWLLRVMAAQLLIADGIFIAYAWFGVDWKVESGVMQAWLAATVVQIIGVVIVVTQYLFPRPPKS